MTRPGSALARGEWWAGAVGVEADGNIVVEILGQHGDRALLGARFVEGSLPLAVVTEIDAAPTGEADLESLLAWTLAQPKLTDRSLHMYLDGVLFRSTPRVLTPPEQVLVDELIRRARGAVQFDSNDPRPVVPLNDGSMGSLRFMPAVGREYSAQASELSFDDVDGVTVSAALYLDEQRMLFELDIVKADFTPLRRIPALF